MKKALYLVMFVFILTATLPAARPPLEITPLAGIHFGGTKSFNEGRVDVSDAFEYGLMLSIINPKAQVSFDLTYTRADGTLDFTADAPGYSEDSFRMSSNYILLGAAKDFGRDWWRLYIGGDLGTAWFDSRASHVSDAWFFSLAVKGGAKFYFGERLGLRIQGRLLMPFSFSDSGFWLGIGSGGGSGGVYFGGNVVIFQGDLTLGLILRL